MKISELKVEIPAKSPESYPIIIGRDILKDLGNLIKGVSRASKLLVVTNNTVYSLYGEEAKNSLDKAGLSSEFVFLEDGEIYKNINSLQLIWEKALAYKLERRDAIVALGGGIIGDITGFAASSCLRGIDFIQVPTTLLSQVDSSVGGKTGINSKFGKNLIGAFYQPKLVLTDIKTLESLPVAELKVGLAEVLKYGFIEETCNLKEPDIGFMSYLQKNKDAIFLLDPEITAEMAEYCCKLKAAVVNQDEKEAGLRAVLNLGHTIGHAIEKCSNYENMTHGQAIAIGMKGAFYIAEKKELINSEYLNSSLNLLENYGLNYKISKNITIPDLLDAMLLDKKVLSSKVRFVLPVGKAKVDIFSDIKKEIIISALERLY